jgi:hypothetical protein
MAFPDGSRHLLKATAPDAVRKPYRRLTMTSRILTSLALCTALVLPATGALASGSDMKLTPEMEQKIRTSLTEQGYEVRKIKTEDGLYEAYAIKDGKKLELYMDADLNIVKTKTDD